MTVEQIRDKMDRLLDDNHQCFQIMHDESSGIEAVSEAEYQIEENCRQLAELHNQLREKEEMEKTAAYEIRAEVLKLKECAELREKVIGTALNLKGFGYSNSEIASLIGLPESTICSLLKNK